MSADDRITKLEDNNERINRAIYGNGEPGLKQDMAVVSNKLSDLISSFNELKRCVSNRPSWSISVIITLMSSALVGLLVSHFR